MFGAYYVKRVLQGTDELYGLFGLVFGLLAWIYLQAIVLVLVTEVIVVRAQRLWPRALLTPMTDAAPLSGADRRAYRQYARAQRFKAMNASMSTCPTHMRGRHGWRSDGVQPARKREGAPHDPPADEAATNPTGLALPRDTGTNAPRRRRGRGLRAVRHRGDAGGPLMSARVATRR